jgi:hypothetical protein
MRGVVQLPSWETRAWITVRVRDKGRRLIQIILVIEFD